MLSFPNCKINIGLNILAKRKDEYHDLQTIFYPIAIKDALEIIEADTSAKDITFSSSGIKINGTEEDNLCMKAFQLLKKDFPKLPSIKMHLHKTIPMGAGLGGGSADAAFALQLLNKKFFLHLTQDQLLAYALQLGSDCPFFILNKPCYATGRGEILEPFELNLSGFSILIVNPRIHINTAVSFSAIRVGENKTNLKELITTPITEWKNCIINDFENNLFSSCPEIAVIKNKLYANGAMYASMSGSGSSVYGIFLKEQKTSINFPAHYFYRWV